MKYEIHTTVIVVLITWVKDSEKKVVIVHVSGEGVKKDFQMIWSRLAIKKKITIKIYLLYL